MTAPDRPDNRQDEGRCTCHLPVAAAGYCPRHEPEPCPVYSDGDDGWHCSATGPHDQHHNAAGEVTW